MCCRRLNLYALRAFCSLSFLFFFSFSEAAFWESIPSFPQAEKIKQEETVVNNNKLNVSVYSTAAPPEEIAEFYNTRLPNSNWSLVSRMSQQGTSTLIFSKGDNFLNLTIQNIQGKNFISLIQGKIPAKGSGKRSSCPECDQKQLEKSGPEPTSDTLGEDLRFVPRYPESVRVSNTERDGGKKVNLAYYSKDPVEKVVSFYLQNMANYYWKLENEVDFQNLPEKLAEQINTDIKGKSLVFKSATASCIISITEEPQNRSTIIGVNYNEK